MVLQDYLGKENQLYYAGQWSEAGVYVCLDPCAPEERLVVMTRDGILPDPTHGWIARFRRVHGHEGEAPVRRAVVPYRKAAAPRKPRQT